MAKISSISGFPEYLPNEQIVFNRMLELIRGFFEKNGFTPLDTPVVERISTLQAKGVSEHEIYGLYRLGADVNEKKELALRFDLTIPLARYVAQHYDKIAFPYRRYHIAPVWRGERAQAGRYRQFYQCDIDIIGDNELSLLHDAEVTAIIFQIFKAIDIGKFTIRLSNRNLLRGLLLFAGITDEINIRDTIRIIDKLDKISLQQVQEELLKLNLRKEQIHLLIEFISKRLSTDGWLGLLKQLNYNAEFVQGVEELEQMVKLIRMLGVAEENYAIDPTIARGLDYYTGTIYETRLDDHPELGSICSGGRYANLAENFTKKKLPGVGISIGLSRLINKLMEVGKLDVSSATVAKVLITTQSPNMLEHYVNLATLLRNNNVNTELYLENKPLSNQMRYASKKGFTVVVIASEEELSMNKVIVRNLISGEQKIIDTDLLVKSIKQYL
jgi:histidyl-tRNA synthetase